MEVEYTPEQIQALEAKANLATELEAKLKEAESNVNSTVEELKELRQKKQAAEDIAKAALDAGNKGGDVEQKAREIVKSILDEEKSTKIEMTRSEFEAKFKTSNPEFLPENDPAGIKFEAFKKVLGRFNTQNLNDEESLAAVYGDAYTLMTGTKQKPVSSSSPYAFSPVSGGGIKEAADGDLSPKEEKLIESSGWTKEKYLKLKTKQPQFVSQLLSQI